jgi:hypothetical protein
MPAKNYAIGRFLSFSPRWPYVSEFDNPSRKTNLLNSNDGLSLLSPYRREANVSPGAPELLEAKRRGVAES